MEIRVGCGIQPIRRNMAPAFKALTLEIRGQPEGVPPGPESTVWAADFLSVPRDGWCPPAPDLSIRHNRMFVFTGQLRRMILPPSSSFPPPAPRPPHTLGGELVSKQYLEVNGRWFELQLAIFTCNSELLMIKAKL